MIKSSSSSSSSFLTLPASRRLEVLSATVAGSDCGGKRDEGMGFSGAREGRDVGKRERERERERERDTDVTYSRVDVTCLQRRASNSKYIAC
jgi:hypothetical protein